MVELREITMENLDDVLNLKVAKGQESFVSTTAYSLAQAWVSRETGKTDETMLEMKLTVDSSLS